VEESVSNVKKQEASENKQPVNEAKKDVVSGRICFERKKSERTEEANRTGCKRNTPEVKKNQRKLNPRLLSHKDQ
jgi:hypothetical protein